MARKSLVRRGRSSSSASAASIATSLGLLIFVAQSSLARTLEVGIEHSELLEPVPRQLQRGNLYRPQAEAGGADRWAIIPPETAGKWRLLRKFGVSSVDLQSGKRSVSAPNSYDNAITYIGYQRDKPGQVWTSADIESKQAHSNGTYLIPSYWNLKQTSDHSFTVVKRGFSVSVDQASNVIQDTKQLESFASFELISQNKLLQKYSTQWFDAAGAAVKLTDGQTEMERAGEFKPINELNGIDVRASFKRFLRESH